MRCPLSSSVAAPCLLLALTTSVRAFSLSSLPLPSKALACTSRTRLRQSTVTTTTATDLQTVEEATPTLPPVAPTAKRIFWVRHGEVINPGGPGRSVYYGAQDVPLSPLGELEAQAAADYLQGFDLAHVFASPLQRAVYGAEQVLLKQQQQQQETTETSKTRGVTQLPGFKELDRGAWCGRTKQEIGADNLARFDACDERVTPAGGESYPQLVQRVLAARDDALATLQPGEMAAVVSHLQVTRSILSDAVGIPTEKMTTLPVATASVTCIDYPCDSNAAAVNGDTTNGAVNGEGRQQPIVHFQSFKPEAGLAKSKDGAN